MVVPAIRHSVSPAPEPPANEQELRVWREEGQVCAYGYTAAGADWIQLPAIGTFRLGAEVVVHPLPAVSRERVLDAYQRSVLPLALNALGGEALHASGVLGPAGVVALCGESGTGKSTLAAALGQRGHPIWADDAVAFESAASGVVAVPLPFRTSLRPAAAAKLALAGPLGDRSDEPLAAVLLLRRDARRLIAVRRLSGGKALSATLDDAYSFRPEDRERTEQTVAAYLELVSRVPVFEVRFEARWEQLEALTDAVEELVRSA